jgi:hypothetical protein
MDRCLINHLWPRGIKDIDLVHSIVNDADRSFCDWINAALKMMRKGATGDEIRVHLFNSHSGPPKGEVSFRTTRRRTVADDAGDE